MAAQPPGPPGTPPPDPSTPPDSVSPPPGWYPDPSGSKQRYWDGTNWTQHEQPTARQAKKERKRQEKASRDAAREAEEEQQDQEPAEAAFNASPIGRARAAKSAGQRFFQVVIPIENVNRGALDYLVHTMNTLVTAGDEVGPMLTAIEDEGWELISSGFFFRQTGAASRDKMLASGQQIAVLGDSCGVYLFRARG
jgi:Protein of unknown function (DUF2510)